MYKRQGLFVAFVGLQNAKLIVNSDSTLVTYQHFKGDTFSSVGMGAILALLGIVITAILLVKKVKGGIQMCIRDSLTSATGHPSGSGSCAAATPPDLPADCCTCLLYTSRCV